MVQSAYKLSIIFNFEVCSTINIMSYYLSVLSVPLLCLYD